MEKESNGGLASLDTFLKHNNGKVSVLVYRKLKHTDQYFPYKCHHQTSCKESIVSSLFNRAYCVITNKEDLAKENARIMQLIKDKKKPTISKTSITTIANFSHNNKRNPVISKRMRSE